MGLPLRELPALPEGLPLTEADLPFSELRTRQNGGLAVRLLYLAETEQVIVEVKDHDNPDEEANNFVLDVMECLALGHPDNPNNDPNHVFFHPFGYQAALNNAKRKYGQRPRS